MACYSNVITVFLHSVCLCPGPWKCWKKVLGKCVVKKPTWKTCCKPDPICVTKNVACNAARKAALTGLKVARNIVDKSKVTLKAAEVALQGAKRVVMVSKRSLDVANHILEGVKKAHKVGTSAVSAIARFGLGGAFDLKKVSFDVALSTAATGHFKVSATAIILDSKKQVGLNLNLRDITSFAKELGERVFSGLKKFIS